MSQPRVLIVHNQPALPVDHPDADSEYEVLDSVEHIEQALMAAGYDVQRLGVGRDPRVLIAAIADRPPDAVFNLFEGLAEWGDTEAYCIGLLDWFRIPFTGCPLPAVTIARDKPLTKLLLRGAGLPTADFFVVNERPLAERPLDWPLIVKPANQDASVGVDHGSVVSSADALETRAAQLLDRYGPPIIVEQYIPGREFLVWLCECPELTCLPIAEYEFHAAAQPGVWPIVTYHTKWSPESNDYQSSPLQLPARNLPQDLARRLEQIAQQVYRLIGCRDYARVDFRVTASGEPFVLEINPNPDLNPGAGFATGLKSTGMPWASLIVQLVEMALCGRANRSS